MRRMLCTVLAAMALVLSAGPANAQEAEVAEVAEVDPSALVSLLPSFDDGGVCTGVPDTIPGIFDFTDACAAHDACYGAGEQTHAACDSQFRQDMNALCLAQHPSALDPARYACLFFAQLYYVGVSLFGSFF